MKNYILILFSFCSLYCCAATGIPGGKNNPIPGRGILSIEFVVFKDNIGTKGQAETRQLFKSLAAYKSFFGHPPPAGVDFSTEWVVFYSGGAKTTNGYFAAVTNIALSQSGITLKITTSLISPDSSCTVTRGKGIPYVLARFRPPQPKPELVQYYEDNKTRYCRQLAPGNEAGQSSPGNDRWNIAKVSGIKGASGRLNMDFPPGVEWDIDIYSADNKFIINRSLQGKHFFYDMPAGIYNMKLNTVPVENVPIEAGKETSLRAGVLDITFNGHWELHNESNTKFFTSGNKPKKLALPIGKYQLQQGNDKLMVVVNELMPALDPNVLETDQWVAKPLEGIRFTSLKSGTGRLNLDFGEGVQQGLFGFYVYKQGGGYQENISNTSNLKYMDLPPGIYTITWSGVGISYENVKILKDYETSLKHGLYKVQTECSWQIDMNMTTIRGEGPRSIAFPGGTGVTFYPPGNSTGYYTQFDFVYTGSVVNSKNGYLQVTSNFSLQDMAGQICIGYTGPRTVSLAPGKYKIQSATGPVTVEIKPGETVTR